MNHEPSPRRRVTFLILGLFGALWVVVGIPLWYIGAVTFMLWGALMALIALFALLASLSTIKPATMILSTFLGAIDKLDARKMGAGHGIFGTHVVLNFPPQLAQAYILPMGAFTVPFKPINATTQEKLEGVNDRGENIEKENFTPVIALVQFTVRLPVNLEKLRQIIEVIDFLSHSDRNDLTGTDEVTFYRPKQDGMGVAEDKKQCFRIAKIFATLLQPTVDEALSQVIAERPLSDALRNRKDIETAFLLRLNERSIIKDAGLLSADPDIFFDLNLVDIGIVDPETAQSISAGTKERYTAKGVVQNAQGLADAEVIRSNGAATAIRNRARAVADGGPAAVQVLAAQAIADAASKNTTFVAGLNLLEAGAAAIARQPPQQPPT